MFGAAFGMAIGIVVSLICWCTGFLSLEGNPPIFLLFCSSAVGLLVGIASGILVEAGLRQAIQEEIKRVLNENKNPNSTGSLIDPRRQQPFVRTP